MSLLDGLSVAVRLDSEALPGVTLGVLGGGGDGSPPGLLMRLLKPKATVLVSGAEAAHVAPAGDPRPGAGFPLVLAALAVIPAGVFALGWAAGRAWGRRQ